eukprot:GILJ01007622.1.p1 GENE.GILJ01007622.1~~GILJ01007622.1.p1  ORF type:complete len:212 (-),score=42.03 GILJ01007622.1:218-853(-)
MPRATKRKADENDDPRQNALLEEFQLEIDSRCRALQTSAEDVILSLRNAFHVELMKIPKKIRMMPLSEFQAAYEGDISDILKADIQKMQQQMEAKHKAMTPKSTRKKPRTSPKKAVAESGTQTPKYRTRRVTRSTKAAAVTAVAAPPQSVSFGVGSSPPRQLALDNASQALKTLSDPSSIYALSAEARNATVDQLKALQEQVASIMKQIAV